MKTIKEQVENFFKNTVVIEDYHYNIYRNGEFWADVNTFVNDKEIHVKKENIIDIYIDDVKIFIFDNDIKIKNDKGLYNVINKLWEQDRQFTCKQAILNRELV